MPSQARQGGPPTEPPPEPHVGVNWTGEKPYAFCGKLQWDVRPLAHTKQNTDIVHKAITQYEESLHGVMSGKVRESERIRIYEDASKTILEACLEGFEYEKAANDPEAGPGLLGRLAVEVKDFLFAGGAAGMRLLQMQIDDERSPVSLGTESPPSGSRTPI